MLRLPVSIVVRSALVSVLVVWFYGMSGHSAEPVTTLDDLNAALQSTTTNDVQVAAGDWNLSAVLAAPSNGTSITGAVDSSGNPATRFIGGDAMQILATKTSGTVGTLSNLVFEHTATATPYSGRGAGIFVGSINGGLNNVHFLNNKVVHQSAANPAIGSALYVVNNFTGDMTDVTFSGNEARQYATAYIGGTLKGNLDNVRIENNSVSNKNSNNGNAFGGAGLSVRGGMTGNITQSTFRNNNSSYNTGGGVDVTGTFKGTVSESVFENNTSGQMGAGMTVSYFVGNVKDTDFIRNRTVETHGYTYGAGLYAITFTGDIIGTTFTANESDMGGGLYVNDLTDGNITNTTFTDNIGRSGGGAAILAGGITGSISDSTFQGNKTNTDRVGGALYVTETLGKIENTKFIGNSAGAGGAVYLSDVVTQITGGEFTGNSAAIAGGAIRADNTTVRITDSAITGNTAGSRGGFITTNGKVFLTASAGNIMSMTGNYANNLANVVNFDGQGNLTLNAGAGSLLEMHGSITGTVAAVSKVGVVKNGTGEWHLGGASVFTAADDTATTSFKVNGGNLHLYGASETPSGENATIAVGGTGSSFVFGNGTDAMTLSIGGNNAITSGGSVLFRANTNIEARDGSTGLTLGGGNGSTTLEGALTLTNDKALNLNAAFASTDTDAGVSKTGGGVLTLSRADTFRNVAYLNLRQGGLTSTKNQTFNRLDSAVGTAVAVSGKLTMGQGTLRGTTTAGSFEKNGSGGLSVMGPMTVDGRFTLTSGTLHVFLDEDNVTIRADQAYLTPDAKLNITGFGSFTNEECYAAEIPVISTTNGVLSMITNRENITVAGVPEPKCEFMLIDVFQSGNDVVVAYKLNWYNDSTNANGLFGIGESEEQSDATFELGSVLRDRSSGFNPAENLKGWEGEKLTKGGFGTLILTNNKNEYSGGSFIENGTLVAAAPGALGTGEVDLSTDKTTLVLRYDADDFATQPVTATNNAITGSGLLEIDGNVKYTGNRSTHTGDVNVTAGSTFTSDRNEAFQSNLTTGAGSSMVIGGDFTVNKGSIAGTVTADNMVKNGDAVLKVDGKINLAGNLDVQSGGLDLMVGSDATITAQNVTFANGTSLNIRGVSAEGAHRVIGATTVNGPMPSLTIGNKAPSSDSFLMAVLEEKTDGVYLTTGFAWNHKEIVDDRYHLAHGIFDLDEDAEFILNVPLADRDPAKLYKDDWDGKTMYKTGDGYLGIACANEFTGGVEIHGGTLNAGCENALGSGRVVIADGATLELDHDGEFANPLADADTGSGTGRVVVRGEQTWLNSPAGVPDAFTGTVHVESGSVSLGNSKTNTYQTGGSFALAADTVLAGNGTIGGLTVASGAHVALGYSIGTITVNGDVAFESGSVYEVETDPADEGSADLLVVNGTADLGGATVRHTGIGEETEYPAVGEWVILTATGGYGASRFADTVESRYLFLEESLLYQGNDVLLRVGRAATDFADFATTPNQIAVANVLDNLDATSSLYNRLLGATDADSMPLVYDQLSGEMHPSLRRLLADYDRDFGFSLMDRSTRTATAEGDFPIWVEGQGFENRANGRHGVAKSRLYGARAALGAEKLFLGGWLVGGAFQYGNTTFKADDRNSRADVDSFSLGLYAGRDLAMDLGVLRFNLGAAYSYHDIDSERSLNHPLLGQKLEADYKAHTFQGVGDIGFAFFVNRLEIEPYLRLGVHSVRTRGFRERGGDAALDADGETTTNVSQTFGVRTTLPLNERVSVQAGAGWLHTYGTKESRNHYRFTSGGGGFAIHGVSVPRNAAKLQLGVDINLTSRADLYVGYDGYLGSGTGNHAGRVALQLNF